MWNAQRTPTETPLEQRVSEDGAYHIWPSDGVPLGEAIGAAINSPAAYRCFGALGLMNAGVAGKLWYCEGKPSDATIAIVMGIVGILALGKARSTTGQPQPK